MKNTILIIIAYISGPILIVALTIVPARIYNRYQARVQSERCSASGGKINFQYHDENGNYLCLGTGNQIVEPR